MQPTTTHVLLYNSQATPVQLWCQLGVKQLIHSGFVRATGIPRVPSEADLNPGPALPTKRTLRGISDSITSPCGSRHDRQVHPPTAAFFAQQVAHCTLDDLLQPLALAKFIRLLTLRRPTIHQISTLPCHGHKHVARCTCTMPKGTEVSRLISMSEGMRRTQKNLAPSSPNTKASSSPVASCRVSANMYAHRPQSPACTPHHVAR